MKSMQKFSKDTSLFVGALKKGDHQAFEYLIKTYRRRLCIYANSLTKDVDLAEDIVQNVFLKLWRKRESFDIEKNLNGYLHRVTYNEFIDNYRAKKEFTQLDEYYMASLTEFVEEEKNIEQAIKIVKSEIENLPQKVKEVFKLSKMEGMSNQEIADYRKVSVKTVEAQMSKAFSILREKLSDELKDFLLFFLNLIYHKN